MNKKMTFLLFFALIFLTNSVFYTHANRDENQPVIKATQITGVSISLSWNLADCDIDCNVYHYMNFISWELYQSNKTSFEYSLTFNTSILSETYTIVTELTPNTIYMFYVKLFWDWSNLNPEIVATYGRNLTSNPIQLSTLDEGEVQDITYTSSIASPTEDRTNQVSFGSPLFFYVINVPFIIILIVRINKKHL